MRSIAGGEVREELPGLEVKVFAIRDVKADAFGPPFLQPTRGLAVRFFEDMLASEQMSRHVEDFSLFEIGRYNSSTARMVAREEGPEFIGGGADFAKGGV